MSVTVEKELCDKLKDPLPIGGLSHGGAGNMIRFVQKNVVMQNLPLLSTINGLDQ